MVQAHRGIHAGAYFSPLHLAFACSFAPPSHVNLSFILSPLSLSKILAFPYQLSLPGYRGIEG